MTRSPTTSAPLPRAERGEGELERELAEIYKQHYGFVWRTLRRLGVYDDRVDDAVHDVFVVAARRLHEFEGRAAITSWLFSVAVHVAQHRRRDLARHRRRKAALALQVNATEPTKDAFARQDAKRTLHAMLDELDDEQRHVFILMELEQMTGREVAEILGIKPAAVHSRLRAAREQLRRLAEAMRSSTVRRSA